MAQVLVGTSKGRRDVTPLRGMGRNGAGFFVVREVSSSVLDVEGGSA